MSPCSLLAPLALLGLLSAAAVAGAQPPASPRPDAPSSPAASSSVRMPSGVWTGTLRAGPIAARLRLAFAAGAPGASGSMGAARITPESSQPELSGEIRDLAVRDRDVTFSVPTTEGTIRFTGVLDALGGMQGRLTVVGEGGGIEARGIWSARSEPATAGSDGARR